MTTPDTTSPSRGSERLHLVGEDDPAGVSDRGLISSSELVQRLRDLQARNASKGDRLRVAFQYCHRMVFSVSYRITGSTWDAEDVTQSVFEELSNRLDKIRHLDAIPSFVKTTAVRISLRRVNRDRWQRGRLKIAFIDHGAAVNAPLESATTVRQLLAQLPPDERAAVVLKYVELHTHDEVAALMGVSSATARRRLASARTKLEQILGEQRLAEMLGGEQ